MNFLLGTQCIMRSKQRISPHGLRFLLNLRCQKPAGQLPGQVSTSLSPRSVFTQMCLHLPMMMSLVFSRRTRSSIGFMGRWRLLQLSTSIQLNKESSLASARWKAPCFIKFMDSQTFGGINCGILSRTLRKLTTSVDREGVLKRSSTSRKLTTSVDREGVLKRSSTSRKSTTSADRGGVLKRSSTSRKSTISVDREGVLRKNSKRLSMRMADKWQLHQF